MIFKVSFCDLEYVHGLFPFCFNNVGHSIEVDFVFSDVVKVDTLT